MMVFFIGPGNSGSTTAGIAIAAKRKMFFVGESLQLVYRKEVFCRCGRELSDCEHLTKLKLLRKKEAALSASFLQRLKNTLEKKSLIYGNRDIARHVLNLTKINNRGVVDTSKDPFLAVIACLISRKKGQSCEVVYPKRGIGGYVASYRKRFPNKGRIPGGVRYFKLTFLASLVCFFLKINKFSVCKVKVFPSKSGLILGSYFVSNDFLKKQSRSHYISGSQRLAVLLKEKE